ncbi:MAG: hypothetical protein AB1351_01020, partial [Thermoproteota archaeon]
MLRNAFSIALAFLITASALAAPAYSLGVKESGPLTAFRLQYPPVADMSATDLPSNEIRTDFGAIDLGKMEYNGNIGRTLIYGSGNA